MAQDDVMKVIQDSAKLHLTAIIAYQDNSGVITQREVEPYELRGDGLYAHCYMRDGIRYFKLDKIMDARLTKKQFVPRWDIKIN